MEFLAGIVLFLTLNFFYKMLQHSRMHYEGGRFYAHYDVYRDIVNFFNLFLFFTPYHIKFSFEQYQTYHRQCDLGLLGMIIIMYALFAYFHPYLQPTSFSLGLISWLYYRYSLHKMLNETI